MRKTKMEETQVAILVGVNLNKQNDFKYSMEELKDLALAPLHWDWQNSGSLNINY